MKSLDIYYNDHPHSPSSYKPSQFKISHYKLDACPIHQVHPKVQLHTKFMQAQVDYIELCS
jgi:hypothetical protein